MYICRLDLERQEANISRRSWSQEIFELGNDVNQLETERTMENINETKSWLFEKNSKIEKNLSQTN
jgi:ribosome-binding protein aMBF1 (putative translation factor)